MDKADGREREVNERGKIAYKYINSIYIESFMFGRDPLNTV